jgi:hypothetical protein
LHSLNQILKTVLQHIDLPPIRFSDVSSARFFHSAGLCSILAQRVCFIKELFSVVLLCFTAFAPPSTAATAEPMEEGKNSTCTPFTRMENAFGWYADDERFRSFTPTKPLQWDFSLTESSERSTIGAGNDVLPWET